MKDEAYASQHRISDQALWVGREFVQCGSMRRSWTINVRIVCDLGEGHDGSHINISRTLEWDS